MNRDSARVVGSVLSWFATIAVVVFVERDAIRGLIRRERDARNTRRVAAREQTRKLAFLRYIHHADGSHDTIGTTDKAVTE